MERFLQMLGVLAALYILYALSLKNWDYDTESKRLARRAALKEQGLSNTFYFIHARTLFILNVASGGLFAFYWLYRQWQAVLHGFKRQDGQTLSGGPFLRTLGGLGTFFQLNAIICRTCEYMHHKPPLPPWAWGPLWLGGLSGTLFGTSWIMRLAGYLFFCGAPAALQGRLNALPKSPVSAHPKASEITAAAAALVCVLGLIALCRVWL